jgi:hypothetical protein
MSQAKEPEIVRVVRSIQKASLVKSPDFSANDPKGLPVMRGNEDHTDPEYPTRSTCPEKPLWQACDTIAGSGGGLPL